MELPPLTSTGGSLEVIPPPPLLPPRPPVPLSRGPGHRRTGGSSLPPRCEPRKRTSSVAARISRSLSLEERKPDSESTRTRKSLPTFEFVEIDHNGKEEAIKLKEDSTGSVQVGVQPDAPPGSPLLLSLSFNDTPLSRGKEEELISATEVNSLPLELISNPTRSRTDSSSISWITFGSPSRSLCSSSRNACTALIVKELMEWCNEFYRFYDVSRVKKVLGNVRNAFLRFEELEKEGERINAALSAELFRLRDAHISRWRITVLGDVVPFRCDPPIDSETKKRKSFYSRYLVSKGNNKRSSSQESPLKGLRSNPVVMEVLEKPLQQWARVALRKVFNENAVRLEGGKEGSTVAARMSLLSNYTEREWKKEKAQIEKEIEMWKIKNDEFQHNVRRGTHIKNLHGLLPVSAHDPRTRKEKKMVVSAPDPSRRDLVAELRLDLRKEQVACEKLSERVDFAEEALRKRYRSRAAQHSGDFEKEQGVREELRKVLTSLESAIAHKKSAKSSEEMHNPLLSPHEDTGSPFSRRSILERAERAVQRGYDLLDSFL